MDSDQYVRILEKDTNRKSTVIFYLCMILMVVSCFLSLNIRALNISVDKHNQFKQQAIELGFAHYNSTNGLWQWNSTNK